MVKHRLISGKPSCHVAVGNPEGSPSDPVTTDPKGEACRPADNRKSMRRAIRRPSPVVNGAYGEAALDPEYVTGLAEGEGCFCVSFALRPKLRTGLEVRPSFSLSLNEKDRDLLERLQAFFECGSIRRSEADRTFKYEARSAYELTHRITPHFECFPLRGAKAKSFEGFSQVCRMIEQGDHLSVKAWQ